MSRPNRASGTVASTPSGPTVEEAALRPPGAHLLALESRAPMEAMASLALWPLLMAGARGDGHSVLVFPGLATSDITTLMLRSFLRQRGWDSHGWNQGLNLGLRKGVLAAALAQVHALCETSGRKVSLVGWSLGGIYARELAKMAPEAVRTAISLGSPVMPAPQASNVRRLYELVSGKEAYQPEVMARMRLPPVVPTTSIFSRTDGIVAWRASQQARSQFTENIEVRSSHSGMGVHPAVLHIVADRLAQPDGAWQPYRRRGLMRLFQPESSA